MTTLDRRKFLATLGLTSAAAPLWARPGKLKITGLELVRLDGHWQAGPNDHQYQVNPIHVYDELRPKEPVATPARNEAIHAIYLKLQTDAGLEGLHGPIDPEVAIVVDQQLRSFITGKDPLAGEALWDQMWRSNRHSRASHFMMAISAIDNAVWDLRGRYYETPVYRLLGGPTRANVECYASMLGHSIEPDKARAKALEFQKMGFRYQKWFIPYGPGSGPEGMIKNVELVKTLREAVGPATDLMFDAFSGWTLDYAIAWAKQVEQYRPRWIEEAFPPNKIGAFAELHRATSVPVASGEHFYSRYDVYEYLKAGAVSVVQADPEWCGGITELVKICSVASLYDALVIPHGHCIHAALHVVASQSPALCPLVEYLWIKMQSHYHFEKDQPRPVNARLALPERPGFGIELDAAKVERQSVVKW
jgi:L-rhamnonate dehydratase